jgi:hypothetical protein
MRLEASNRTSRHLPGHHAHIQFIDSIHLERGSDRRHQEILLTQSINQERITIRDEPHGLEGSIEYTGPVESLLAVGGGVALTLHPGPHVVHLE